MFAKANILLLIICTLLRKSKLNAFTTTYKLDHRHLIRPSRTTRLHEQQTADSNKNKRKKVVVVGGGWAGYSICESLSTNDDDDVEIILLDAAAKASGGLAGGFRDKETNNRPVEAGIHGFWREYKNTFDIMESIEGVTADDVLSGFTPSVLFSKNGRVALAPVLGNDDNIGGKRSTESIDRWNPDSIRRSIAANLPPPLDLPIMAEFDSKNKSRLNPLDLTSAIGLLGAWADFEQESPTSWKRYDSLPATELFEKAGISEAVYEELVSPLLHVLPMCPAYDCSAAAALSCFHVFALQSRGAFDVRWCNGNMSEKIFEPWQKQLERRGVLVQGGARVTSIEKSEIEEKKYTLSFSEGDKIECDAVVLAVGATSMGKIAASSNAISSLEGAKDFDKLRGITCVAVRLFLKPHHTITSGLKGGLHDKTQLPPDVAEAMKDSPIAVCGANIGEIQELKETGFCIYDLQRMHNEFSVDESSVVGSKEQVAVLEVDFYRANEIANLDDDDIVKLTLETVAAALGTSVINADNIVDKAVVRARNAVSHFAPNSAIYSPDVKLDEGLYICGDWVDRCGHASWSTEKSVVTARQAASVLSRDLGLMKSKCNVIPAAKDTPQLSALRQSARLLRSVAPPKTIPPSPWILAKQLLSGKKDF